MGEGSWSCFAGKAKLLELWWLGGSEASCGGWESRAEQSSRADQMFSA